jgi:Domain of unknown function (DUF4129)
VNTHTVDPRTLWALLAMEAGLALPIISLPTQGDRIPGMLGPSLLLLLLPLGCLAVREVRMLREPSWRLLTGIGLALVTRAFVVVVPEPGVRGLALWFGRDVIPVAIGVGLWWRGGALGVAELTAAEVRTEFGVLSVCMLATLALVRPFILGDPVFLGLCVGLFGLGGLVAMALARQDAADVASAGFERALAAASAVVPLVAGVVLVSILRPSLLGAMWTLLGNAIELALTPVGLLIAWLASLFPRGTNQPPPPPQRPPQDFAPDPAMLAQLQDRVGWIGTVVLVVLVLMAAVAALLGARLLLSNWIGSPVRSLEKQKVELTVERTGTAKGDAQDLLGWMMRWLRERLGRQRRVALADQRALEPPAGDAWAAYRGLLEWAERQGVGRRPTETTGQLQARLVRHSPQAADAVDLVTSTFACERYGDIHPPGDRLKRVQAALRDLADRPR